jgi:hypothetical protein
MRYKNYLIDIKPFALRDGPEWTVHVTVERDLRDQIEFIKKIETGNRFKSESEASQFGELEGKRFVDGL